MTTSVPDFPSSGVTLSSFGASPKQAGAFPAVSAEANFGAVTFAEAAFEADARAGALAGFFAFFSCLAGSAAQVTVGLITARLSAKIPIAIVILRLAAEYMISLHYLWGTHRRFVDYQT
jgi:hypothetical protein